MAQDRYAALGLGADDRTIHPIDAHGVSVGADRPRTGWCADSRTR
ncbi:hypothetical protein [Streptomyces chartreusis]